MKCLSEIPYQLSCLNIFQSLVILLCTLFFKMVNSTFIKDTYTSCMGAQIKRDYNRTKKNFICVILDIKVDSIYSRHSSLHQNSKALNPSSLNSP